MKNTTLIFVLILSFSVFGCTKNTKGSITVVSTEEMQTLIALDNVQLVDVRSPQEYNQGHVLNAQNIDFSSSTFEADISGLDKEKPVILYCASGWRSAKCAEKMLKAGFKKIYDYKEGFSEWKHAD